MFARHRVFEFHKELFKTRGHYMDDHKTTFFKSYVRAKAKNTATGLAILSREMVYSVDSGASLHEMGNIFSESQ